ncbi:type I-E CRISPR-associated protein Cas6/Cse3/CasE [Nocardia sp. 2YAB30]|uniref:type I-E CRISPR-associated protein Cas6/Cse3/CasE n=1 Tax=unclassified Nocardia TaxID=2637762 RepID=UPI003F9C61DD
MTLWLTRIHLNTRDRVVARDLSDSVRLHQRLMKLMPDGLGDQPRLQTGMLYRLDQTRTGIQLLVQSNHHPEIADLPTGYGDTATRDLEPMLATLDTGNTVHYRLTGNTCKRLGRTADRPGKLVALHGEKAQDWWLSKARSAGLTLTTVTTTPMRTLTGRRPEANPRDRIQHAVARFDGVATVTDPDLLRQAIRDGIGRGKAHGCGLLSLAVAR